MAHFWSLKLFWCPFCERDWGPKGDGLQTVRTCKKHRG